MCKLNNLEYHHILSKQIIITISPSFNMQHVQAYTINDVHLSLKI